VAVVDMGFLSGSRGGNGCSVRGLGLIDNANSSISIRPRQSTNP
jgi:hypothetical protein